MPYLNELKNVQSLQAIWICSGQRSKEYQAETVQLCNIQTIIVFEGKVGQIHDETVARRERPFSTMSRILSSLQFRVFPLFFAVFLCRFFVCVCCERQHTYNCTSREVKRLSYFFQCFNLTCVGHLFRNILLTQLKACTIRRFYW